MDEFFIMDDGGCMILEEMTSDILATYEEIKAKIIKEYDLAAE